MTRELSFILSSCFHVDQAIDKILNSSVYKFTLNKKDRTIFGWIKKMSGVTTLYYSPNDAELAAYIVRLYNTEYFFRAILFVKKRCFYWARLVSEYLEILYERS